MRFSIPLVEEGAFWIQVDAENGDTQLPNRPILLRLGVGEDGRLVATGIHIGLEVVDTELTARDLRLPLARIVSEFTEALSDHAEFKRLYEQHVGRKVDWGPEGPMEPLEDAWQMLFAVWPGFTDRVVRRRRPGRAGHGDEHYRQVAAAYLRAKRLHPHAPIRALMEELYASEPTVHRWLRIARDKGFLTEAPTDPAAKS